MIELLLWPFFAGLVLTGIHAHFGLHVLARGVVFVDLSLAQVAALGMAVAILAGHPVHGWAAYWYALAFATGAAVLFAIARPYESALPQEAVIGIVYAVSAALGVIVLDRAPQGGEHIKQLLIGSILGVTPREVLQLALLYGAIGLIHFLCRRPLAAVTFRPAGFAAASSAFFWDLVFYVSFALVVTSSVRIAGVLLVFSYLIVPAALAGLLAADLRRQLLLAWAFGAALTAAGLCASAAYDLPTGPAIVAACGAAIALAALGGAVRHLTRRRAALVACALAIMVGLPLAVFPRMDQPWLDALEDLAPPLQTAFLSAAERRSRSEALAAMDRDREEHARLAALNQDVRWGKVAMDADRAERLRQYLAGRSEISAGDRLVLRYLRGKARERQRFAVGLPLCLAGSLGLYLLLRRRQAA